MGCKRFFVAGARARSTVLSLVSLASIFWAGIPGVYSQAGLRMPAEYGDVVYQLNPEKPDQVFIIGISHRDSLTLANDANTSNVQAEVYRIGEWCIRNEGVELLLPEGFFRNARRHQEKRARAVSIRRGDYSDNQVLKQKT